MGHDEEKKDVLADLRRRTEDFLKDMDVPVRPLFQRQGKMEAVRVTLEEAGWMRRPDLDWGQNRVWQRPDGNLVAKHEHQPPVLWKLEP